jgi:hypothetical protein
LQEIVKLSGENTKLNKKVLDLNSKLDEQVFAHQSKYFSDEIALQKQKASKKL